MKVTAGRTVICRGIESNGALEHPAIVTRAWSDRDLAEGPIAVNLTVLPDAAMPVLRGSVLMFDTREAGLAYLFEQPHALVAFFPDRA